MIKVSNHNNRCKNKMMNRLPNNYQKEFESIYEEFNAFVGRVFDFICREIDGINKKYLAYEDIRSEFNLDEKSTQANNAVAKLEERKLVIREQIKGRKRGESYVKIYLSKIGKLFQDFKLGKSTNHKNYNSENTIY